jgi:4-hydroxy-tetrahydrodipicolinate reductase
MTMRVLLAGATGNVGRCVVRIVVAAPDLTLVAAVARQTAGRPLADVMPGAPAGVLVSATVAEALRGAAADVLIDYTHHDVAVPHALAAVAAGLHVVIGATGFDEMEYERLDAEARAAGVAIAACDNFAVTAALLNASARLSVRHVRCDGVLDVAAPGIRAPLNTTRRLAAEIAEVSGQPVHMRSIRDGSAFSVVEATFQSGEERLIVRHESDGFAPYAHGACIAARALLGRHGLYRRLDDLL